MNAISTQWRSLTFLLVPALLAVCGCSGSGLYFDSSDDLIGAKLVSGEMTSYVVPSPNNVTEWVVDQDNDGVPEEWGVALHDGVMPIMDVFDSDGDGVPDRLRYFVHRVSIGNDGTFLDYGELRYIYILTIDGSFESRMDADNRVMQVYVDGRWIRKQAREDR